MDARGGNLIILETLKSERSRLLRFLVGRIGCQAAADDILQALSEKLVRDSLATRPDNPKAYLFRAVANAAHSYERDAKTRFAYEAAAAEVEGEIDVLDPERRALGRDAILVVNEALGELPVLTRRMFILFRVEGEAQKEIAKRFGVSLSTVEKRIAKAAAHCHERLREAGFGRDRDESAGP